MALICFYFSNSGSWKLILCHACGSNGTHGQCSAIKCDQEVWYCSTCQTVAGMIINALICYMLYSLSNPLNQ